MTQHPNALAAFLTTAIAAALVHLAGHFQWVSLTPTEATAAAGGAVGLVLFVGRKGIVPTAKDIVGWVRHGVAGPGSLTVPLTPTAAALVPLVAAGALSPDAARAALAASAGEIPLTVAVPTSSTSDGTPVGSIDPDTELVDAAPTEVVVAPPAPAAPVV